MLNNRKLAWILPTTCIFWASILATAGAQTTPNTSRSKKSLPPAGIEVPVADRAELERDLSSLDASVKDLAGSKDEHVQSLLPDVQIFQQAVRTALTYNEFFDAADIAKAKELLQAGRTRADQLLKGESPWVRATGLVVRGYVSKIDGSVQPYGLVVPISCRPESAHKFRLDIWLHGRNEKLSEVNFLDERSKKPGEFTPQDTIVLHPYGRYCNAFKFAGEMDVLEAIDAVKRQYRIDDDRIAMRGFSMGGAGCWHLAVHYADRWVAAAPGAGFAETEQFTKMSDEAVDALPEWQKKLLLWYDCPPWAANLYQLPTIAYNGEDDPQKQAADVMEKALADEGMVLRRIVGPHTKHQYEPAAKKTVDAAVSSIAETPRDRVPSEVHLVTYTLRYNRMDWVQIDGLAEQWSKASVDAALAPTDDQNVVNIDTKNVTDLTLSFAPGWCPLDVAKPVQVAIDNQELDAPQVFTDRSWECKLHRDDQNQWQVSARELGKNDLRKRPGLQGPIDDAFMDSFIIVRPTGTSSRSTVNHWVQAEMDRAIHQWRSQFRGAPRVKDDSAVTDDDIASANLILWGDEQSNSLIKRINDQLPIHWQGDQIVADRKHYSAADRAPILIYPNPLNHDRYVVLNSGFTFRESDYTSNALQVPRLPDWALIDIRTPPDASAPGKVEDAGFFGEAWELNPTAPKPEKNKTAANN
jgi:pimeloyl-ACP methyl ester carboxylesterase